MQLVSPQSLFRLFKFWMSWFNKIAKKTCFFLFRLIIAKLHSCVLGYAVWMLQATNCLHLQHGNNDDDARPWLLQVEQCPQFALLWVWFLQSWCAWRHKRELAQALGSHCHHACASHRNLFHWVLCFQKHKKSRNGLSLWWKQDDQSSTQMGLLLVSPQFSTKFNHVVNSFPFQQ